MTKTILALCALALSVSTFTTAFAADGDCTTEQLVAAIQKKCGSDVRYTGGNIGHYQGEVTDTYVIPMKDGKVEKNMSVVAEGGNCADDTIGVLSVCP